MNGRDTTIVSGVLERMRDRAKKSDCEAAAVNYEAALASYHSLYKKMTDALTEWYPDDEVRKTGY